MQNMPIVHVNYLKARLKNPTHGTAGDNVFTPVSDLSKLQMSKQYKCMVKKCALKALKKYFFNLLLTISEGFQHKHNIFSQSYNSFAYFRLEIFIFVVSLTCLKWVRLSWKPMMSCTSCTNQDLAMFELMIAYRGIS